MPVKLPAYNPGCDADPEAVRCGYQPFDLDKIQNREFAYSGSPAAALIQRFRWDNDDQNQVASYITSRRACPPRTRPRSGSTPTRTR